MTQANPIGRPAGGTVPTHEAVSGIIIESFPAAGPYGLPETGVTVAGVHPKVLLAMDRPEVNLTILHRDLPSHLSGSALAPLFARGPFTAIATGHPRSIADQLAWLLPNGAPGELLEDIGDLAAVFSMLDLYRDDVRVRLRALNHKGCSRWHADYIGLRMLCTYHGPGTEWLSLAGGAAAAQKLSRSRPPRATGDIPVGAVAVMKGERHPHASGAACIHRSPWVCPEDGFRLLLSIDQPNWNLDE